VHELVIIETKILVLITFGISRLCVFIQIATRMKTSKKPKFLVYYSYREMERLAKNAFKLVNIKKMNIRKHIGKQVNREFVYFGIVSCILLLRNAEFCFMQNEGFRVKVVDLKHIYSQNFPKITSNKRSNCSIYVDIRHIYALCRLEK